MKKLLVFGSLALLLSFPGLSVAGVHISVNIPLPPPSVFPAPPELLVILGAYVYYCPDVDFGIRSERLQRAKDQMVKRGLGALVTWDAANIRYLTSHYVTTPTRNSTVLIFTLKAWEKWT